MQYFNINFLFNLFMDFFFMEIGKMLPFCVIFNIKNPSNKLINLLSLNSQVIF
jgi:hypothetical protein